MKTFRALRAATLSTVLLLFSSLICADKNNRSSFRDADETDALVTQVTAALKEICPKSEVLFDKRGRPAGCQQCPHETAEGGVERLTWDLTRAFTGHFTSWKVKNLILSGRGCESHSANFGGTFVFRIEPSGPKLLHYNEALITEECHKFQTGNSGDKLVCTDNWGAQSISWSYVYLVAFGQQGKGKVDPIFEIIDKSGQPCGIDFIDEEPTTVQESKITNIEFRDRTERPTLLITAMLGERNPTDEERRACNGGKPIELIVNHYPLQFVFDGDKFRPSAESQEALKHFPKAELPTTLSSTNP